MTKMLVKCETRSSRVKGVCFHPTLKWALAALHTGTIQLWDYRIGTLIDKFEEHEGPVRGIDFHPTQQLFVSGGDDYKVKLWSLSTRRCIYTFLGHLDYIRTTFFHKTYPWILSASDDQTVRVWNWQSRQCIGVLTGHTHYVMSAVFHPTEDYILSASLDQTVRVWDTSGLRERAGGMSCDFMSKSSIGSDNDDALFAAAAAAAAAKGKGSLVQKDLFSPTDVVCKFVLEGHERGVNWAAFHPNTKLIASGGDDRLIKLWRYNKQKAWEVDTLRGHLNNISCLIFSHDGELLISNSEDRTLKVWDVGHRTCLYTYTRDNDRFWVVNISNDKHNIVCGHDSGMLIFKLACERPRMARFHGHKLIYAKKDTHMLMVRDYSNEHPSQTQYDEVAIAETKTPSSPLVDNIKSIIVNPYNPNEINVLVLYDASDSDTYEIVTSPMPVSKSATNIGALVAQGSGFSACFITRNRFAVVDRYYSQSIRILDLSNELVKTIDVGAPVDAIFSLRQNVILIRHDETIRLYDITSRSLSPELHLCLGSPLRSIVISNDGNRVAVITKHSLLLLKVKPINVGEDKQDQAPFDVLSSVYENFRIKGGAWDERTGGFIYSTLSHMKYCLSDGDKGILFSLQQPVYIIGVENQHVIYIDRDLKIWQRPILSAEYILKQNLTKNRMDEVALLVRRGNLCGNALIAYLREKGYSEIALEFLPDKNSQFLMALQVGRLAEALEAAVEINRKSAWRLLLEAGCKYGDFGIMEFCYKRLKMYSNLLILYFVLGSTNKLEKMYNICNLLGNSKLKYMNSLYIGDAGKRIDVLNSTNNFTLAHLAQLVFQSKQHETKGYPESNEFDNGENGFTQEHDIEEFTPTCPDALTPPIPIQRFSKESSCWPKVSSTTATPFAEALQAVDSMQSDEADRILMHKTAVPPVGEDLCNESIYGSNESEAVDPLGDAGDWSDGIDLPADAGIVGSAESVDMPGFKGDSSFVLPGDSPVKMWTNKHKGTVVAHDQVAAGDFAGAINTLRHRLGLLEVSPLRPIFERIYQSTWMRLPGIALTPSLNIPLYSNTSESQYPYKSINTVVLLDEVKEAHKMVTAGRFSEALHAFRSTLQCLALAVADDKEEEQQFKEILDICTTYVVAMSLEVARGELGESDMRRNIELVAYFACCKLQPSHAFLVIRRAMSVSWKAQNFLTTAAFARRLISGNFASLKGAAEEIAKARKVLVLAEQKGTDAYPIDFDPSEADSMVICSTTLTRIEPGTRMIACSFCGSKALSEYSGRVCSICNMGNLGARVIGLHFQRGVVE